MTAPTLLAAALTAAALALPAAAQAVFVSPPPLDSTSGGLTGQRAEIARELPLLGYRDVDVRRLSRAQVAHIAYLLHSDKSPGDIRGHVGVALRGGGFLQGAVDALGRR